MALEYEHIQSGGSRTDCSVKSYRSDCIHPHYDEYYDEYYYSSD